MCEREREKEREKCVKKKKDKVGAVEPVFTCVDSHKKCVFANGKRGNCCAAQTTNHRVLFLSVDIRVHKLPN